MSVLGKILENLVFDIFYWKCMLFHTGDLGSRLDTLDNIETEKNCPYPQIASLLLNSYHLFNSCWCTAWGLGYVNVSRSVTETMKVVRWNGWWRVIVNIVTLLWRNCTLREQDPKHTVTEYIVTHVHINFYSHSNSWAA